MQIRPFVAEQVLHEDLQPHDIVVHGAREEADGLCEISRQIKCLGVKVKESVACVFAQVFFCRGKIREGFNGAVLVQIGIGQCFGQQGLLRDPLQSRLENIDPLVW